MERLCGLIGMVVFLLVAWFFSGRKRAVSLNTLAWGLGLQFFFAVLVIGVPVWGIEGPLKFVFDFLNDFVVGVLNFSLEGSRFVFGPLVDPEKTQGFIFAISVLPTLIFFSALISVLYHIGLMQLVVRSIAWVMARTMKTSGAESLASAANIFLGQTEAPLAIRPYLPRMTKSELFAVMVGGMANAAGGVLAAYVGLLQNRIPNIAGHLMTVSILTAPGSLLIAKLMMPEVGQTETGSGVPIENGSQKTPKLDRNVLEACARGTSEGLELALNVAAMLIAFIAMVALCNALLGFIGELFHFSTYALSGGNKLSLQLVLGWLFSPVAILLGIPWHELTKVGSLLGEKVVLNEFVAYLSLTKISAELSDRSVLIASYALCGFANVASIGIQIGGIGAMAPERKSDVAELGVKALIGGSLSTFLAAALVGILI